MARQETLATDEQARLLRGLAFQIHRKQPADEVLREHFDEQFRMGRRREYRAANDALAESGFAAALRALGMIGDEGALLLAAIVESKDHRLLATALNLLADRIDG